MFAYRSIDLHCPELSKIALLLFTVAIVIDAGFKHGNTRALNEVFASPFIPFGLS